MRASLGAAAFTVFVFVFAAGFFAAGFLAVFAMINASKNTRASMRTRIRNVQPARLDVARSLAHLALVALAGLAVGVALSVATLRAAGL